jgi:hypothetical protein
MQPAIMLVVDLRVAATAFVAPLPQFNPQPVGLVRTAFFERVQCGTEFLGLIIVHIVLHDLVDRPHLARVIGKLETDTIIVVDAAQDVDDLQDHEEQYGQ